MKPQRKKTQKDKFIECAVQCEVQETLFEKIIKLLLHATLKDN